MRDQWLELLESSDYDWRGRDQPASEPDLEALASYFGRPLPADYETFLRRWSGCEVAYRDVWTMRLWSAHDIPIWSRVYGFTPERILGAMPFGDNGGGEALVFDTRPEHADGKYLIVAINFVSIAWNEALPVADGFRELLQLRRPLL